MENFQGIIFIRIGHKGNFQICICVPLRIVFSCSSLISIAQKNKCINKSYFICQKNETIKTTKTTPKVALRKTDVVKPVSVPVILTSIKNKSNATNFKI